MRIGIIGLLHESNTFIGTPTTLDMFRSSYLLRGPEVRDAFEGGNHEVSGFFSGLKEAGLEAAPLFLASTAPSGTITAETCDELMRMMFSELEAAGPLDGVLVAPHGANVGEGDDYRDLDGHWLSRLRSTLGPDTPIVCTVDAHANLSPRMVDACTATIAYRTNPHIDQKERGLEAARLLARTLRGEVRPTQAAAFPPVVINIERQMTSAPPCLPMYEKVEAWRSTPGVLSASAVLGFSYSDVEEMGASFIAVTDADPDLASRIVEDLAEHLRQRREDFVGEYISVSQAVDRAAGTDGPVCLLDMGDNVGGGSAADGTTLAHELHKRGDIPSYICLYDPESVGRAAEAGVGARISLRVGGKTDDMHGPPLEAEVTVRSLHEGRFHESEIRHGGLTDFDMGLTAVVATDTDLTFGLTSRRVVPVSIGMMTSCGLDPADFQILVAKGVHAPVAGYQPASREMIRVDTPGATAADARTFSYTNRRKPLYPFEEI
ncbi:MAG: M81 family metallopeptidase [Candidatus Latescibacteria bacterium]|jgi:microcystin degradation protein MlrC|nr:M81 family metallopeptidase [Candidatus Latescibacterota bacterium]